MFYAQRRQLKIENILIHTAATTDIIYNMPRLTIHLVWVSEAVVKVSMSCTALLSLSLGDQFDYSELKSPTRIEYVGCCLLIPKSTCR